MTSRIDSSSQVFSASNIENPTISKPREGYISSLSSCSSKISCRSFCGWLYSFFVRFFDWIFFKIIISYKDFKLLEELIDDIVVGGAVYVYDKKQGTEKLRKILKDCSYLYNKVSGKWFSNFKGIVFMQQNLLKIRIRLLALFGEEEEMQECKKRLIALGFSISQDVEQETNVLLFLAKHQIAWSSINFFMQSCVALLSFLKKMRGRRGSNPQLPP